MIRDIYTDSKQYWQSSAAERVSHLPNAQCHREGPPQRAHRQQQPRRRAQPPQHPAGYNARIRLSPSILTRHNMQTIRPFHDQAKDDCTLIQLQA